MFLHQSPFWLKAIFPDFVWRIPTKEKKLFITFDDGPIPDITEWVLSILEQFHAKATFFCIGDNVRKHPQVFRKLQEDGHAIGNHTFNHLNGWNSENNTYLDNIEKCNRQLDFATKLFRPPYGRIKKSQSRIIRADKQIIMWDVLSGDFSQNLSPEICLKKTIKYTRPGSIILFHDSIKASKNMQYALPRFLEHYSQEGYTFEALPMQ